MGESDDKYKKALLKKKGLALFLGQAIGPPPCGGRGDDGPPWVRYGSVVRAGFSAPGVVKTCQDRGHVEPRVGGVDDYQGQEERIIFISTVVAKQRAFDSAVRL